MSTVSVDPSPSVVPAILAGDPTAVAATIAAVRGQVYEPGRIAVVGGDREARRLAEAEDVEWSPTPAALLDRLDPDVTHVWVLRAGTIPRADALLALVREAERVGAGIAGSKVLDVARPARLVSVGISTDVFDAPYTGLDEDERDQGQYDVVRDVAAVSGASMLVRRDLALGLRGPDPALAPVAMAVDLCQRARLRGGRVVVIPSSVVRAAPPEAPPWREEAGRLRALAKVYGPVTLAWVLPAAFVNAIIGSILAPFAGRWTLFAYLRAWLWNLVHLPSTLTGRRAARRGRLVGDEELFRYQVPGPLELKTLVAEIGDAVRRRLPDDERLSVDALGRDLRRPAVVGGLLAVVFVLLAIRSIWSFGLPAVGHSLPFPPAGAALRAYAGGWNPAGFGGVHPLPPLIGLVGAVETILLGNHRLAEYVFVAAAYGFGITGVIRLLRTFTVRTTPALVAGVVYVAGPMTQGIAASTSLGALFAIGVLPWAVRAAAMKMPRSSTGRLGRVAAIVVLVGLAGLMEPVALLAPLAAAIPLVVFAPSRRTLAAIGLLVVGTLAALPLLSPWVEAVDLRAYLGDGRLFWAPSVIVPVAIGIVLAGGLLGLPKELAGVAGWGGVLAAGGAVLARLAMPGVGRPIAAVALGVGALGVAVAVGAVSEGILRVDEVTGWRRVAVGLGLLGVVSLVGMSAAPILGGRAGLPGDTLHAALDFTAVRSDDPAAARVLMVGDPELLPGDARVFRGSAYRVVSAPMAALWENELGPAHGGDRALAATLDAIAGGEVLRGGEALAPFGIRWIVVMGRGDDDPHVVAWKGVFGRQLDLVSVGGGLAHPTFVSETEAARAATTGGTVWTWRDGGYEGPRRPGERAVLAENPHPGWGPGPWRQTDWRNSVAADTGRADFTPLPGRRTQAIAAAVWLLVMIGVAVAGRRSA